MIDIKKLCREQDLHKPDFLKMAVKLGKIQAHRGEPDGIDEDDPLNEKELQAIQKCEDDYYKESWQASLLRMIRFQKPLVANVHKMTKFQMDDPDQKLYAYIGFFKPGRHIYVVSHHSDEANQPDFYLHDMLAQHREEPIPNF